MHDPLSHKVQPRFKRKQKKPLSQEVQSTYRVLLASLLILGLSSSSVMLVMNAKNSAYGTQLMQTQAEYEQLLREARDIDRDLMEALSVGRLEEALDGMESASSQNYDYAHDNYAQANY